MIYPANFEEKIGFSSIRSTLKSLCISNMGIECVEKMSFLTDLMEIEKSLHEIEDFRTLLNNGVPFPVRDFFDLREDFKLLSKQGTVITVESLFALKPTLAALWQIIKFLSSESAEPTPHLKKLSEGLSLDKTLYAESQRLIDDKGDIPDSASAELSEIRQSIRHRQSSIDRKMRSILTNAKTAGWTDSSAELTIRNGRLVIPVKASDKRSLRGFIHDESATGQTVYIEPAEIFDTNNEIRELEYAEKREINKILTRFTELLRNEIPSLIKGWDVLGMIDFIRAKALFYNNLNCTFPATTNQPLFDWRQARHPILEQKLHSQNKEITPLDLHLDKKNHILVISGPNAGGKSVCLKTIGLLQYMFQCGLPVPMRQDSTCGIFHHLFLDIGDEQSLENDLSTYSSHLLNMKNLLSHADGDTLFLIDEFGTGTEPQLGGAIAEATLLNLNKKGAFGLVTTHYANLKLLADTNEGIINGAMLFDTRFLQPMYLLMTGKPGSSFAFEIAKNIGFPKEILDQAAEISGKNHLNFEKQLQQLDIEKKEIQKKENELRVADNFLNEVITKYQKLLTDLEKHKSELLKKANTEAQDIIKNANAKIEKTIREIKECKAEKEMTQSLRKDLNLMRDSLQHETKNLKEKSAENVDSTLHVGDDVCILDYEILGEVTAIEDNFVEVRFGSNSIKTSIEHLKKMSHAQARKASHNTSFLRQTIMHDIQEKAQKFNLTLDIRGFRYEEAETALDKYLDEAKLLSIKEVSILHGKGNGILRQLVRQRLSHNKDVVSFADASLETGGAGITRVSLK